MIAWALGEVLDGKPGITTVWELLIFAFGAATSFAGFTVLVWRIARPHVQRYVESVVAPMRNHLVEVREEVKPNHGDSLKDRAVKGAEAATSNARTLEAVAAGVFMLNGKLDSHISESREYLRLARDMFEGHGINLPEPPEDGHQP